MPTLLQDIRYAFRTFIRNPIFALVTILTLALGIGANTAIFCILNSLIRPLNVPEPDRLVRIYSGPLGASYEISYPNFLDLRASAKSFSGVAVYSSPQSMSFKSVGQDSANERVWGSVVSGNYFDTLGVSAAIGRTFAPDEDAVVNARPVVVISHHFWEEKFNRDPTITGRAIRLNGQLFEIIGVAPDRMLQAGLLLQNDFWVPMMMEGEAMPGQGFKLTRRGETFLSVIARLRPGVTLGQARAEAGILAIRMENEHPKDNHQFGLSILTERESRTPFLPGLERFGWIILAIVGLVLLIACGNIAGLVLVRSLARRREFGIRISLGASRSQLVRQLVTEGLMLSLSGGLLGLGVALIGTRILQKFAPPLPLEISVDTSIDYRVLLFMLCASLATGILVSIVPALRSTKLDLSGTLKTGDSGQHSGMLARDVLVIGQIAVSLLLLIMAGLFARSLVQAQQISLGFDPEDRLLVSADTSLAGFTEQQSSAYDARLLEAVHSVPGVIDVSSSAFAPLSGGYLGDGHVYLEGEIPVPDYERPQVFYDNVGPGFFRAMGTPLLAGRDFVQHDLTGKPLVAVVNQTFADSFWPGKNPIGRHLKLNSSDSRWIEVVGVVPTGKYRTLGESPQRHLFIAGHSSGLVIHTVGDPRQYKRPVLSLVKTLNSNVTVTDVQTMNEHLGLAFYPARTTASMLGLLSLLGLLLAMLGLYGLLAFVIRRRTREVGIRMALGAQKKDVMALVLRQGGLLVATGGGLGLVAAYGVTRLVAGMLYGVSSHDLTTFAVVPILMGIVALSAIYVPARYAARVDPSVALRFE